MRAGLVGQAGGYEGVSQGLLLQQAALALQMAHLGSPAAHTGLEGELSDASSALATALRQQGEHSRAWNCRVILWCHPCACAPPAPTTN